MTLLGEYLNEIRATRSTGAQTAETSFYPALKVLLDAVGSGLRPKVKCIMNLRNQGAGLPDGGLFTPDQVARRFSDAEDELSILSAAPSRGAIEVKPPSVDMETLAKSSQVSRYGGRYSHVLLTNLREFWLVRHHEGRATVIERFVLAESESRFGTLLQDPAAANAQLGERFLEFLERVIRTPAPLTDPEDLAWFLASYAKEALARVEHGPVGGFDHIAEALGLALGVGFPDKKTRHFFNSTLVQTLFYGVFSAWVLWCRSLRKKDEEFSWKNTSDLLHLTALRVLFHEMTAPTTLFTRFLREGLDLAQATLNRVDEALFFSKFREHEAVQYFYEPFLEAFDPALRKELGVWYTPDEIVRYMVERIDRALRDQLGIASGFADPSVLVLDPCCGTGGFLVAVLDRIVRTLREQGDDSTVAAQAVQAATGRVFGFEILPAPFVISHMQVGFIYRTSALRFRPMGALPSILPMH